MILYHQDHRFLRCFFWFPFLLSLLPIHPNWQQELRRRGVEVIEDVLADEASAVLRDYGDSDQPIYNARSG